jgi:hypothetical protein
MLVVQRIGGFGARIEELSSARTFKAAAIVTDSVGNSGRADQIGCDS